MRPGAPAFLQFEAGLSALTILASLNAVGVLAAVSAVLADAGIPCNAVSAFHHDHLFVPRESAQRALELLMAVAATSEESPGQYQPPST
jgi:hypothetical protein